MKRSGPIIAILLLAMASGAALGQADEAALAYLEQALGDPALAPVVMMALRTTGDEDLLPLFVALTRSADKRIRLFATSSMWELADANAAPALLERLDEDPAMVVRAEAIAQLVALDAIPISRLVAALNIPDENVQLMAARALVNGDNAASAIATLETLTESPDDNIAVVAHLLLLAAGDESHLAPLREFAGLNTFGASSTVVGLLLGQVEEYRIAGADDLARDVIAMNVSVPLNIQAWRALSAISDDITDELADAIGHTYLMHARVQLLRILAARSDAPRRLQQFVDSSDDQVIAALSAFELSRLGGASDAAEITQEAMDLGHPGVLDYVLSQAAKDITAGASNADQYVPALLSCILSVRAESRQMEVEHLRAAQAATLLANHGSPEAIEGLREILGRRYNALVRAVAAGVMKSTNPAACDLMRPLLTSPYSELSNDAALTLGRFGDSDATDRLGEIVARPGRYEPALVVLASWYLLKANQQSRDVAEMLAEFVQ